MNVEKLKANGIDYDEGVHRFSGKESIYLKYLRRLPETTMIADAKKAVAAGDIKGNTTSAFENFHNLKAFVGNLSISELFEKVCELTDVFRSGSIEGVDVDAKLAEIEAVFDRVCQTIKEADE